MPRFNGAGPMGQGPMTGRGMGLCGNGQGYGRGAVGRGGFWSGVGRWFSPFFGSSSDEKDYLKEEVNLLKEDLQTAQNRLKELEKNKD